MAAMQGQLALGHTEEWPGAPPQLARPLRQTVLHCPGSGASSTPCRVLPQHSLTAHCSPVVVSIPRAEGRVHHDTPKSSSPHCMGGQPNDTG